MTVPGILLVERAGRRKVLLFGAIIMCICQLIVGATSVGSSGPATNNVLVAFTCLFIATFAATWGPCAWVLSTFFLFLPSFIPNIDMFEIVGELFPLKHRARGMSLATASNWWWNWVIAFVVPYITDASYGDLNTKIAFIWFGTCFIGSIWTFFFVPETRRHSLETLDEMFESGVKPWNTNKWVPAGTEGTYRAGDVTRKHAPMDQKIEDRDSAEKVAV